MHALLNMQKRTSLPRNIGETGDIDTPIVYQQVVLHYKSLT